MTPQDHYIALLFAHWFGDFLLQTNRMALKKSSSSWWLTYHCAVYGVVMSAMFFTRSIYHGFSAMGFFFGTHFIIDFLTSRISKEFYESDMRSWFFNTIGLDQAIHHILIFAIWSVYLN